MADLGNTSVLSPVDASNGSGTMPSWLGSAAPSTLDDAGRALQGAVAREWQNRSFTVTSSGTAPNFVVAYTVAPAAYRTGQVYSFIAHAAAAGSDDANINTLGAKNIKKLVGGAKTALAANDFAIGDFLMCAYDGTDLVWINNNTVAAASTIVAGKVELATDAETQTGTDTARAITPANLTAKEAIAGGWFANTANRILTTDIVWGDAALISLTWTSGGNTAVDMATGINFTVTAATGNSTLGQPSNTKVGQTGVIRIIQDPATPRTLAYHADWKFAGGTDPTLTATVDAVDLLFYQVIATNFIYATLVKAVA